MQFPFGDNTYEYRRNSSLLLSRYFPTGKNLGVEKSAFPCKWMIVKESARKARAHQVRLIFTVFRRHFARFITHLYFPLFFPRAPCHLGVPYYFPVITWKLRAPFLLLLLFSYHYFFLQCLFFIPGQKVDFKMQFCMLQAIMRLSWCIILYYLDEV